MYKSDSFFHRNACPRNVNSIIHYIHLRIIESHKDKRCQIDEFYKRTYMHLIFIYFLK